MFRNEKILEINLLTSNFKTSTVVYSEKQLLLAISGVDECHRSLKVAHPCCHPPSLTSRGCSLTAELKKSQKHKNGSEPVASSLYGQIWSWPSNVLTHTVYSMNNIDNSLLSAYISSGKVKTSPIPHTRVVWWSVSPTFSGYRPKKTSLAHICPTWSHQLLPPDR